jgi:putative lipoprotein
MHTLLVAMQLAAVDPWLGRDKALHFGVSYALAGASYGAGTLLTDDRGMRFVVALTVPLAAGVAKELYDATGRGQPSFRDLAWDGIGTLTGALTAAGIDALVELWLQSPR